MIGRLRDALQGISLCFCARRTPAGSEEEGKEVIEGRTGNVIIVKSPNTEYFKEAIFILSDDLFTRSGISRQQLLRQARRAARAYVSAHVPPRDLTTLWCLFFFLSGAAVCLAVLLLCRLF